MEKYDIFVSYRRDGGEALACLISEKLRQREYDVFYDVESLRAGKFNDKIYDVIDECKDVIVVLPQNCLERCKNRDDWVRKEISYAIEKNKNIVPIMMRNFEFPKELPDDIKELPNYNGISADMEYFDAVFEKLIGMLQSGKINDKYKVQRYIKDENLLAEAEHWIDEIRTKNSVEAKYQLAFCYYEKVKNPALNEEIFSLCKKAAQAGHMEAQNLLGICYEDGIGIEKNIVKAFNCYRIAAENGLATAQCNLAHCFHYGMGKLSVYWMKQAAFQDDRAALYYMGEYYENGIGVKVDCDKANEYYQKAAELGDKDAEKKLKKVYKIWRRIKLYLSS